MGWCLKGESRFVQIREVTAISLLNATIWRETKINAACNNNCKTSRPISVMAGSSCCSVLCNNLMWFGASFFRWDDKGALGGVEQMISGSPFVYPRHNMGPTYPVPYMTWVTDRIGSSLCKESITPKPSLLLAEFFSYFSQNAEQRTKARQIITELQWTYGVTPFVISRPIDYRTGRGWWLKLCINVKNNKHGMQALQPRSSKSGRGVWAWTLWLSSSLSSFHDWGPLCWLLPCNFEMSMLWTVCIWLSLSSKAPYCCYADETKPYSWSNR